MFLLCMYGINVFFYDNKGCTTEWPPISYSQKVIKIITRLLKMESLKNQVHRGSSLTKTLERKEEYFLGRGKILIRDMLNIFIMYYHYY